MTHGSLQVPMPAGPINMQAMPLMHAPSPPPSETFTPLCEMEIHWTLACMEDRAASLGAVVRLCKLPVCHHANCLCAIMQVRPPRSPRRRRQPSPRRRHRRPSLPLRRGRRTRPPALLDRSCVESHTCVHTLVVANGERVLPQSGG